MKIFVTGGADYIGRNLIPALIQRGDTVVAFTQSIKSGELIESLGAEVVAGDLTDLATLQQGIGVCDAVVHLAEKNDNWGNPIDFHRINVTATQQVIQACIAMQIPRLLYLSSNTIIADGKPKIHVDETSSLPRKPLGLFPLTKGLGEKYILSANSDTFETVVVRLHHVWGKDDTVWLPRLVEQVQKGGWAWIDSGYYLASTCHIENAIQGLILALDKGVDGEVYTLTDGQPIEYRNFVANLLKTQGISTPERNIPRWLGRWISRFSEFAVRRFNLAQTPWITRLQLAMTGHEFTLNDQKARDELDYVPRITREQGMGDLARHKKEYRVFNSPNN